MTDIVAGNQTILVVGGGISGVTSALEAAECGQQVILLERGPSVGLKAEQAWVSEASAEITRRRIQSAVKSNRLQVLTLADVSQIQGEAGDYRVSIRLNPRFVNSNCTACGDCARVPCSEYLGDSAAGSLSVNQQGVYLPHPLAYPQRYVIDPRLLATADAEKVREACSYGAIDLEQRSEEITLNVGSVIWAAGGEPFDARRIQAYGAGRYADVISSMDFERMMSPTGPTAGQLIRPSDGREARNIAFIQCAGSRDANYLRHCSGMCCMASLRQASHVMDARGDNAQVSVYYIDMRLSGPFEAIYRQFHEDPRIRFIRSKVAEVVRDEAGNPVCRGVDTEGGGHYENVHDLVVLAVGLEPRIPEGVLPDGVSVNEGGFIESGGVNGGFFAAGVCAEAMDYQGALRSASAAALKAIQVVKRSALAG